VVHTAHTIILFVYRVVNAGRAGYGYDVGEGGNAEGLVFLESHQDKRNSTPATRSGKPSRDQSDLHTMPTEAPQLDFTSFQGATEGKNQIQHFFI
jgi:hypothetical protein